MKLTELFATILDREAPICRRVLERVPEHKADWKPHAKSMPLGYLSGLVASMPSWIALAIEQDELDLNPPGGKPPNSEPLDTRAALVKALDDAVAKGRASLARTNDDFLMTPWKLLVGGNVVQESPRHAVIADTFTHLAHHRGQLTVYLRLNEEQVPSVYGPSADVKSFG
jgi:uncharacterized damage-inducible protein DinB